MLHWVKAGNSSAQDKNHIQKFVVQGYNAYNLKIVAPEFNRLFLFSQ